jgi:hypothetical protein
VTIEVVIVDWGRILAEFVHAEVSLLATRSHSSRATAPAIHSARPARPSRPCARSPDAGRPSIPRSAFSTTRSRPSWTRSPRPSWPTTVSATRPRGYRCRATGTIRGGRVNDDLTRRQFLHRWGAGAALVWSAPVLTTMVPSGTPGTPGPCVPGKVCHRRSRFDVCSCQEGINGSGVCTELIYITSTCTSNADCPYNYVCVKVTPTHASCYVPCRFD